MCLLVLVLKQGPHLEALSFVLEATLYCIYHSHFQYTKVRAKERKQKKPLLFQVAKEVNVS